MATGARAQVFMTNEDYENPRDGIEDDWGHLPLQWSTNDQANETYTPIGEGVLLLAALGGAYLLKKKKNNK